MGTAIVTVKIMPDSPEVNLDEVKVKLATIVKEFAGEGETKTTIEPVAFGLKCLNFIFVMEEALGSPDVVSEKAESIEGVQSAEITDVRRAIG